ncbi:uncharacterized protein MELLADRAFT_86473 [Melampsora larici-populina 98AG31]|uniref:WDR59/RTC1-like RING zinc finger domain-containing protein n=1 Tax=Melampsora larici-populina (strain 98AG31 / pathotype 3-4-7) TaxID=747676 RepID=F4RLY6_MELLP|nr:uncharacterized protein MELLADRAFT_86473 [Melampsora larici-populina 98AG31]EGG06630.1 hypothetical protein MELLADRAFT_86473 [Melampsora larici-populina 98AG31]
MADPSDTFYQTFELSLNEPVGCLSMSRKGLFVIDLNHPYEPPRFLAHSATWDVADIQWSPHPERRSWVASTSSQKALIWNLDLPYHSQTASRKTSNLNMSGDPTLNPDRTAQSPIQFVLEAHTRAICDINWSVFNVDVLATCGIDSWTYAFDLRSGSRAVQGFCAWGSPATQVKWNRQNSHLLASSHDSRVLIWDTRRPAIPLLEIKAHDEKIYGVDWSRRSPDGIVTCSLDKTVKFWSTKNSEAPIQTIETPSPVRRARHLPFGHGVMTLPQRSDHVLSMWSQSCPTKPIAIFSGHRDTVREFVWRTRGGENSASDDRQFQLVTWGNDRKLRLWPVSQDVLIKAGFKLGSPIDVRVTRKGTSTNRSFRHSSLTVPFVPSPPSMSASPFRVGKHSSSPGSSMTNAFLHTHTPSPRNRAVTLSEGVKSPQKRKTKIQGARRFVRHPGFMTRQSTLGVADLSSNRLTWMEGIKLYRPSECADHESNQLTVSGGLTYTRSLSRDSQVFSPTDLNQEACHKTAPTLGEELTSAQRNLPRVTFEQLTVQARTCSVGLYGPWAAREGIAFVRATFTFPKAYPQLKPPSIEIERSSDVSARTRAYLLKSARELMQERVRKQEPGALEICLKFLLGDRSLMETEKVERYVDSDEEMRDPEVGMRPDILQNNTNVPPPRRGGVWFNSYVPKWFEVYTTQRNYKFEAFGTLALSPTNRAYLSDEESESDDALRLPMSRRLPSKPNPPPTTNSLPQREISTIVSIETIDLMKPVPIPALQSFDAKKIAESAKTLAFRIDKSRHKIWMSIEVFLKGSRGLRDCEINKRNSSLFFNLIGHLKAVKDFETLGYVACVLEMNRREHNIMEYDEKNDEQVTTPTDYFNSKSVNQPHAGIASSSSARSGETPDPTSGIESSSQSPSKGSWSQFFFSLTGGTGLSSTLNQVPIGASKTSSSSLTQIQNSASTTSSTDKAVAKLKQQLGVSPAAYDSASYKRRVEGGSSLPHEKNVSFSTDESHVDMATKNANGLRSQRRRVYRVIEYRRDEIELSDTLDDPSLQTELECYRYFLCDLLLRREKIVERTMVVKMLRASDPNTQYDTSSRSRAQGLSGIDESCTIELFLRCGRCGGCLESLERICVVCDRIGKLPICSICHKKVPRLAQDCLQCFHGGHVECMRTWWKDEQMCPTGCGCFCISSGGICGLMKRNEIDTSIGSDSTSVRTMKRRKSKSKRSGNGNKHLSRNTSYVTFS